MNDNRLTSVIMRDSPFAWWEWDVVNDIVVFNDLKVTMLGYDPTDFRGKGYRVFTDLVHPDDFEKSMDAMRDLLSGRKSIYQVDYRILDSRKTYHWYMDRGAVIAREGDKITRLRGIVIDLGAETQSDMYVREVVELLKRFSVTGDQYIPICSGCERIRMPDNEWVPFTKDLIARIADTLSHGICPRCIQTLYPELAERILKKMSGANDRG